MEIGQHSLEQLRDLEDHIPELAGFPSRLLVESYEEFIERLYQDIDIIISGLQENPEHHQDTQIEDRLTAEIKRSLNLINYNATHDEKHGGHADLIVRKRNFVWIGEAKVHRSYEYLWKGFQQLNTRYTTGDTNQDRGGILIYIKNKNASQIMKKWQNHLISKDVEGLECYPCHRRDLAFFSKHIHEKSGRIFRTRHMPVLLYFNPKDRL